MVGYYLNFSLSSLRRFARGAAALEVKNMPKITKLLLFGQRISKIQSHLVSMYV